MVHVAAIVAVEHDQGVIAMVRVGMALEVETGEPGAIDQDAGRIYGIESLEITPDFGAFGDGLGGEQAGAMDRAGGDIGSDEQHGEFVGRFASLVKLAVRKITHS